MTKEYCEKKALEAETKLEEVKKEIENIRQLVKDNMVDESSIKYYSHVLKNIEAEEYNLVSIAMSVCGFSINEHVDPIYNGANKEIFERAERLKSTINYWRYGLVDSEPVRFDGDIIITDPCYIRDNDESNDFDWLEWADDHGICRDTIYGDWSCTTYEKDSNKKLGNFCADSGMVCVLPLKKVLSINPNFDYHINRPWTTTIIKDFHGEVHFEVEEEKYNYEGEEETEYAVHVIGVGNINFYTTQTGL